MVVMDRIVKLMCYVNIVTAQSGQQIDHHVTSKIVNDYSILDVLLSDGRMGFKYVSHHRRTLSILLDTQMTLGRLRDEMVVLKNKHVH